MNIGVVGATGLVGEKVIRLLEERKFPVTKLTPFSSEKSAGSKIKFCADEIAVEIIKENSFKNLDICFFAVDDALAKEWIPIAKKHCIVIDKSSVYRLDKEVPLIVPEVNAEKISKHQNLIANPNCTTIPLVMVLSPLQKTFGIKRVIITSFQSVSGAGKDAVNEFIYETELLAFGAEIKKEPDSVFSSAIAGNIIPQIGSFDKSGFTAEEKKVIEETRKILELPDLPISATCVRVPVKICHSLSVDVELEKQPDIDKIIKTLKTMPNIKVYPDNKYPMPVDCENKDEVFVGRIRRDWAFENGVAMWIVTDNLRKGAATNAVQIAEKIIELQLNKNSMLSSY